MSEPSTPSKHVRYPKLATPARYLFALFLVATGLMTMMFGVQGYPLPVDPSPFRDFMQAMADTGYIIFWVGLVKFIAGCHHRGAIHAFGCSTKEEKEA